MLHGEALVSFAQPYAGIVAHEGEMDVVSRRCQAELLHDIELLGCGEEQVFATYNLRDIHHGIVDGYGKLICPCAVAPSDYEISAMVMERYRLWAAQVIAKCYQPSARIRHPRIWGHHKPQSFPDEGYLARKGRRAAFAAVDYMSVRLVRSL